MELRSPLGPTGEIMKNWMKCAVLICVVAFAACAAMAAPKVVYVKCGKLIFDAEKAPIANADVIITDGKVTAVGAGLAVPDGAEVVDLSNYTVLPGLVDAHIHIWSGPPFAVVSDGVAALRGQKAMAYALGSGVAAVRVLGTTDFLDVALRDAIDEGTIPGPHMIPAGHAISIPAGHGDHFTYPPSIPLEDWYTPLHGFINSPADAEKAVHLQLKYGARVIKILASGGVLSPLDSPDAVQVSPEELKQIVETAHGLRVKVAAHVENREAVMDAICGGRGLHRTWAGRGRGVLSINEREAHFLCADGFCGGQHPDARRGNEGAGLRDAQGARTFRAPLCELQAWVATGRVHGGGVGPAICAGRRHRAR